MGSQRFRAVIAADPQGRAVIAVPFDPDMTRDEGRPSRGRHHRGQAVRGRLQPGGSGWMLPLGVRWQRDMGYAIGDHVTVELAPEGPQRGDPADDIAAALAATPAAGASFDTLAQFYRKATFAGSMRPSVGRTSAQPASPK